jgi:putative peptide zinc metalloprotease protein
LELAKKGAASGRPLSSTSEEPLNPSAPRLADGIELVGEYKDSGFKTAPYIARRSDGQVIQMSPLAYAVAEACDGRRGYQEIAATASQSIDRHMSSDHARFVVENKLRPVGVLAGIDGKTPELKRSDPMLALKLRAALVPEGVVEGLTTIFRPLFWPPIVVGVLVGLVALDYYVFVLHGVAQGVRSMLYQPTLMLLVLALIILSAAFHEIGHATACRYGGAKPGVLGAGIYIVWPALYSDVTDAYRLGKGGRLRTDLGGVYFNVIFMLATAGAYFWTHYEPLLVVIALQNIEIIHQFLPFLRLDGYYIIADLTGVPDIFGRIRPVLRSLIPGRETPPEVAELKPWVRVAVTAWVLVTIPVVICIYGFLVLNAPRIFATAWDSLLKQVHIGSAAWSHGDWLLLGLAVLQAILLTLPSVGLVYSLVGTVRRLAVGVWHKTQGQPLRRAAAVLVGAAIVAVVGWAWMPHSNNYAPIRPTETGTLAAATAELMATLEELGVVPAPRQSSAPGRSTSTAGGGTTTSGGTTTQPIALPSTVPVRVPVTVPVVVPVTVPTAMPSVVPSAVPSVQPTVTPSPQPSPT